MIKVRSLLALIRWFYADAQTAGMTQAECIHTESGLVSNTKNTVFYSKRISHSKLRKLCFAHSRIVASKTWQINRRYRAGKLRLRMCDKASTDNRA
eukprot:jgi/Chrzof1/9745/Cz04g14090.t1